VDRLACVDLPELPLQLLLRRRSDWSAAPVAVVAEDRPAAFILWVNERARRSGVLPGLRYAQGLALEAELRGGTVGAAEVAAARAELTARLRHFTPEVEPSASEPGVLWLGASGLGRLHPSLEAWAQAIEEDLRTARLQASVGVGFSRFGAYALARARGRERRVADSPEAESALARRLPLGALPLAPEHRDALERLGVRDVDGLLRLPPGGLLERFGPEVYRLQRLAAGELWTPLQPEPELLPVSERLDLDEPESDLGRLLFLIKRRLDRMLSTLADRHQALAALHLTLLLESAERRRGEQREEQLRPAAPTLDGPQLLELLRLRLDSLSLRSGVVALELLAASVPASEEQLQLFAQQPRRDLPAAERALARLRAELGDRAVVHAVLRDRHLPEARFAWEPVERLTQPHPQQAAPGERPLVRRLHAPAAPLSDGPAPPPARLLAGPFFISGGWWEREVSREYCFAESRAGELLWIYYDRRRRRWFRQGEVE
jgi:protein ImuB